MVSMDAVAKAVARSFGGQLKGWHQPESKVHIVIFERPLHFSEPYGVAQYVPLFDSFLEVQSFSEPNSALLAYGKRVGLVHEDATATTA